MLPISRVAQGNRAGITSALFVIVLLGAAGCAAGAEPAGTPQASPEPRPDLDHPVGLIAIGHSALTGEGSDPEPGVASQNSWATGTNPDIDSIYQRLVERRPETEGHVANTAKGGAVASTLKIQAQAALRRVPVPELVILQTIDNDIRCDGTDAAHAPELGADVAAALDVIAEASPNSKVLLVSQVGRPEPHAQMRLAAGTNLPGGDGECDFFDRTGAYVPERAAHLTEIIVAYEQAQLAACAAASNCHDDGGAGSAFAERWEYFEGADGMHFNAAGLAALAAHMWPAAEAVLTAG